MKRFIFSIFIIFSSFSGFAKFESLDRIAIIVNDGVVLESQVQSMMQTFKTRLQEQDIPMPAESIIIQQVRERLILEELQLQSAKRAGVRISDAELNQAIANIAAQNNFSIEQFIEAIESEGQVYATFREQIRKEMIIQRVQRGKVGSQIIITDQELYAFISTEEAKTQLLPEFLIKQILVKDLETANNIRGMIESEASFEKLASEYSISSNASQGGSLGWRKAIDLPDLFFNNINNQRVGYITPPLKSGAGFHLLMLSDKRGPLVQYEDQWNVRHILMSPTKLRDETFTQEELEDVRKRLFAGEEFSLLAKEFSEDPGSANKGGELGWLPKGATAPAFEKMMLETKIGEISPVFESQFGFHFLEVLDTRNYDMTQDLIEDRAYGVLFSRKFDEELENSLRTMRAEAFVEFKDLD